MEVETGSHSPRPAALRAGFDRELFLFAFFWILVQLPLHLHLAESGVESVRLARSLASTMEFRDPFGSPTGPTAHLSPVYPAILALCLNVLPLPMALIAVFVLNAAFVGATAGLLPAISEYVFGIPAPGVIGGILLVLSSAMQPQWEGALLGALVAASTMAALLAGPAASGLWMGCAVFTNPATLLPVTLVALRRGYRYAAIALGIAVLVCAPWIYRNYLVVGAPYFVRDNLGLELWISNNDFAGPELVKNPAMQAMHPNLVAEQRRLIEEMGESKYNQKRMQDAQDWIRSNRSRFLILSVERAFYFWFPSPAEGWQAYGFWVITALAIAGAWIGRHNKTAWLLIGMAIAASLPYVLVATDLRYRYPTLWITAMVAGYAVDCWLRERKKRKSAAAIAA